LPPAVIARKETTAETQPALIPVAQGDSMYQRNFVRLAGLGVTMAYAACIAFAVMG
jgi:hypothetical protein